MLSIDDLLIDYKTNSLEERISNYVEENANISKSNSISLHYNIDLQTLNIPKYKFKSSNIFDDFLNQDFDDYNNSCGIIQALNIHYFYNRDKTIFNKFKRYIKKYNNDGLGTFGSETKHLLYDLGFVHTYIKNTKNVVEYFKNIGYPILIDSYTFNTTKEHRQSHFWLLLKNNKAINYHKDIKEINYENINFSKEFNTLGTAIAFPKEYVSIVKKNPNEYEKMFEMIVKKYPNMYIDNTR